MGQPRCDHCRTAFEQTMGRGRRARFCSAKCRVYWHRNRPPATMRSRPRWARAMGKRPVQLNRRPASSTNPTTWTTYEAVQHLPHGFMLGDGIGCYDLDHCIRPDGTLEPWAVDVLRSVRKPIWTEVSRSGSGLHIFHHCNEAPGTKRDGIEHYSRARFIVVTGNRFTQPAGGVRHGEHC